MSNLPAERRCELYEPVVEQGDGLWVVATRESRVDVRGLDGSFELKRSDTTQPRRARERRFGFRQALSVQRAVSCTESGT